MKLATKMSTKTENFTTKYEKFRGVDMNADPKKIDNSRSSYATNIVINNGGFPEKRLGYRELVAVESPINGFYHAKLIDGTFFLIHGGTKLYQWDGLNAPVVIKSAIANKKSTGFVMNNKFWFLSGSDYYMFTGSGFFTVTNIAHIPTTLAGAKPDGAFAYPDKKPSLPKICRSPNMLRPERINSFIGDGSSKMYHLDATELDSDVLAVYVDGVRIFENEGFIVNRVKGIVTFSTAPPIPLDNGVATNKDNVRIEFSKTVLGSAEKIKKCTIATCYGIGTNDRIFFSGNPDFGATDWHSELTDPSYIPELSETQVGSDSSSIMGYSKVGEHLAIIKEDSPNDGTIFLRNGHYENGASELLEAVFTLKQSASAKGAISKKAIGSLLGEALFLCSDGIFAITSNNASSQKSVQNRSWFVDRLLTREQNLSNAVCTEWNGLFLVCVNSHCYVLDGKQNKAYLQKSYTDYVYECFYWDNIPAVCFLQLGSSLYFGTSDGRICRFNTDRTGMNRFSDCNKPIKSVWTTKNDDDGDFTRYKSLQKQGCTLILKPYSKSSCSVNICTDGVNNIEVSNLSCDTAASNKVISINKKVKNYVSVQIAVSNANLDEGMGVLGITKRYTKGKNVKV